MSSNSGIEWTDATWNPVTGCTRVSAGCDNCYAVRTTRRLEACGQSKYAGLTVLNPRGERYFNGVVKCHEESLGIPQGWRTPRRVFVNSMSDLFHKGVPDEFIHRVIDEIRLCSWHTFQVLTKRPERAAALSAAIDWPPNLWLGTSVEDDRVLGRISHLRRTGAAVKFLSVEPLIGPIRRLPLSGIGWVIVGGESGPGARPMPASWVRDIRDRCLGAGVPFFFKQWGKASNNPDPNDPSAKSNGGTAKGGRMLDGRAWDEMPLLQAR